MDDRTRMRLRGQLAAAPRSGPGKGLPHSLRHEVAQHAATRRADGIPIAQIARELGINAQTLRRWMQEASEAFAVVHVAPQPAAPVTFTLTGPLGVRVEGLDLDALAALLRRLAS